MGDKEKQLCAYNGVFELLCREMADTQCTNQASFPTRIFYNTVYQQKLLYMFNFDLFNTNKKEKNLFVLT